MKYLSKALQRIRLPITYRNRVVLGFVGVAVLAIIYSFISYRQHVKNPKDTTLPNLAQLADGLRKATTPEKNDLAIALGFEQPPESIWNDISNTWLFRDITATYWRLFLGLLLGVTISVLIGTLMGCYEWISALLLPPISFLTYVPGTAMLSVFFVLVSSGEQMFIAMIGFGIMPTLTRAIYLAARDDLHEEEIYKAYTLGASNMEVIIDVVFCKILPKIWDNVRLQIGPAMVFLIAAEMLNGDVGMGFRVRQQQRQTSMNVVYDYLFILGVTGLFMDRGMVYLRKLTCPWFKKGNT